MASVQFLVGRRILFCFAMSELVLRTVPLLIQYKKVTPHEKRRHSLKLTTRLHLVLKFRELTPLVLLLVGKNSLMYNY
jgi:hypothetical protein